LEDVGLTAQHWRRAIRIIHPARAVGIGEIRSLLYRHCQTRRSGKLPLAFFGERASPEARAINFQQFELC